MIEDTELLRRYAVDHSESAFAELVQRRVNLVYSVALRQVGGDAHLAEDVTQKVFADLARKAAALTQRPVLTGWLYRSAQFAASDIVRSERRRRVREQETLTMDETTSNPEGSVDWEKVRPVLDEVMGELDDEDRDAVALRFFEERPFAEVGRALGLNEEAARKRVGRALDKLHGLLARRGLTSTTTAALGLALANQAGVAAPVGMAASISATAVASVGVVSGAVMSGAGIFALMSSTKIIVGTAGVIVALSVGTALYQMKESDATRARLLAIAEQQRDLQAKLLSTETRLAAEKKNSQAAEADVAELLKLTAAMKANNVAAEAASAVLPAVLITHDVVEARYKQAQEASRNGDVAAALEGFLWCYDEGMLKVPSYGGVRASFLLSEIAKLTKIYLPALAALQERRDRAEEKMLAGVGNRDAALDFAALNGALNENQRSLDAFDKLPAGDPRRQGLLVRVYDMLITAQRYAEAAQARPFSRMLSQFELNAMERPVPANIQNPEALQEAKHRLLATSTAKHVEVLAGAGDLANARVLMEKLLARDASSETKALLQTHLTRAGHSELAPK